MRHARSPPCRETIIRDADIAANPESSTFYYLQSPRILPQRSIGHGGSPSPRSRHGGRPPPFQASRGGAEWARRGTGRPPAVAEPGRTQRPCSRFSRCYSFIWFAGHWWGAANAREHRPMTGSFHDDQCTASGTDQSCRHRFESLCGFTSSSRCPRSRSRTTRGLVSRGRGDDARRQRRECRWSDERGPRGVGALGVRGFDIMRIGSRQIGMVTHPEQPSPRLLQCAKLLSRVER